MFTIMFICGKYNVKQIQYDKKIQNIQQNGRNQSNLTNEDRLKVRQIQIKQDMK